MLMLGFQNPDALLLLPPPPLMPPPLPAFPSTQAAKQVSKEAKAKAAMAGGKAKKKVRSARFA